MTIKTVSIVLWFVSIFKIILNIYDCKCLLLIFLNYTKKVFFDLIIISFSFGCGAISWTQKTIIIGRSELRGRLWS